MAGQKQILRTAIYLIAHQIYPIKCTLYMVEMRENVLTGHKGRALRTLNKRRDTRQRRKNKFLKTNDYAFQITKSLSPKQQVSQIFSPANCGPQKKGSVIKLTRLVMESHLTG